MRAELRVRSGEDWIVVSVQVPEGSTLLDALETARTGGNPGIRYRHSCHHGSCGTCGALVNGVPRLLCLSPLADFASGPIVLEPLSKQEHIGDLAVLPAPLFRSLPQGASYLRPSDAHPTAPLPSDGAAEEDSGIRSRAAGASLPGFPGGKGNGAVRFESCVECGLCVEACPVERPFVGPAALAVAGREMEKSPGEDPDGSRSFLAFAAREDGAAACDRRFECSRICPQGVGPGRHIQRLREKLGTDPGGSPGPQGAYTESTKP